MDHLQQSQLITSGVHKALANDLPSALSTALKDAGVLDGYNATPHPILVRSVEHGIDPLTIVTLFLVLATILLALVPLWQDRGRNYSAQIKAGSIISIFILGLEGLQRSPMMPIESITGNWTFLIEELFGSDIAHGLGPRLTRRVYLLCAKLSTTLSNVKEAQKNTPLQIQSVASRVASVHKDAIEVLQQLPEQVLSELRK